MEEVKFTLTQSQLRKLAHAMANNIDVTLRLNSKDIWPTGVPKREINKLNNGNSHNLISVLADYSVPYEEKRRFPSGITAFLPDILGGVSAITGIAKDIKDMAYGNKQKGDGVISDLNIPIISPLAKVIGLGDRKTRRSK